jgi:hypothetical protein
MRKATLVSVLGVCLLVGQLAAAGPAEAAPGLIVQDLTTSLSATDLAQAIVGSGVSVSNAAFTGADVAAGTFSGGGTGSSAIIGFDQGVVLSTGAVGSVVGPNTSNIITTQNGTAGDVDLDGLLPPEQSTEDASVLTFDFTPDASEISLEYVFASDEYNEFVGQGFNDVFGFFVNGQNCAMVDSSPVSIDTVNQNSNSSLFRNNDISSGAPIDTEMDGLTTVLICTASVTPNESNTMKLAIGDVGDSAVDSNVFIAAGSLTTSTTPGAPTNVSAIAGNMSATVSWDPPAASGTTAIDSYQVTCTATGNPDDQGSASTDGQTTSVSVGGLANGTEYRCVVAAHNADGFGPDSDPSNAVTPSDANASIVVDSSVGGTLNLTPTASDLGTSGKIVLPAQGGTGTDVVVSAFLFGQPGTRDATCGGHRCIGQGIDWTLSDGSAFSTIQVVFFEEPFLVVNRKVKTAKVYKDGKVLKNCGASGIPPLPIGACVQQRLMLLDGTWQVTVLANGDDPKGRL